LSGLALASAALPEAASLAVSDVWPDLEPLSEGARLKYTVANPAIAAITAMIAYLAGDAACLLLFVEFTSSSLLQIARTWTI
jgi:hypothetical protein